MVNPVQFLLRGMKNSSQAPVLRLNFEFMLNTGACELFFIGLLEQQKLYRVHHSQGLNNIFFK